MSMQTNDQFYGALPLNQIPVTHLLAEEHLFHRIPEDWHIIVTDIKGSTKAVKSGMQQIVNLIASGSIIAALNIGRTANISVPFFFGGDGATLLVPNSILSFTMLALKEHSKNAKRNHKIDLRVGYLPVTEVYNNNHQLLLSKGCLGGSFAIPVVLGNGLKYAEDVIKSQQFEVPDVAPEESILNLEGMECRWDRIKPPDGAQEIVCLLVEVKEQERHAEIFKKVLDQIEMIYGSQDQRNPISIPKLKLKATPARIAKEMQVRLGKFQWSYLIKQFFITLFGFAYFRFYQTGKNYLNKLVELSDTLVLDGRINTVITGTASQRERLTKALEEIEKEGDIFFGLHVSEESVMSCYVRNREDQHIHFVDGSQGGYTQAAGMLKKKLKAQISN